MPSNGSIVGNPAAVSGFKTELDWHVFEIRDWSDKIGTDGLDHGCLPLAGVAHGSLNNIWSRRPRSCMVPVGGEEEEQVLAHAIRLTGFKDGLPTGDIVAPVTIEEDDAPETVSDCVVHQSFEHVNVSAWIGGQRSCEVEMVIGVAEPLQRCEEHLGMGERLGTFDDFGEQHTVGRNRKVVSVLLDGGDGENNGCVGSEVADGRPGKVSEVHGELVLR